LADLLILGNVQFFSSCILLGCIGGTVEGLYYTESTRVSVPSSELAPPPHLPQASVSPWNQGGQHLLADEGAGEPIRKTAEFRVVLALCLLCWWHSTLLYGGPLSYPHRCSSAESLWKVPGQPSRESKRKLTFRRTVALTTQLCQHHILNALWTYLWMR
jgi:hypothetical protein